MIINNTEALKSWMIVVLDPLCDADSSALARYVLALLKKDKPEKELKRVMVEQLDVFLGEETTPFVDRLLGAIKTEEYLIPPAPILTKSDNDSAIASSSNSQKADTKEPTKSDVHTKQQQHQQTAEHGSAAAMTLAQRDNSDTTNTTHEDHKTKENHSRSNEHSERTTSAHYNSGKAATSTSGGHHGNHVRSASPPLKSVNAEKDTSRESRRRRASLRSRSRSRSRSNERASRRSRSRDRRPAKDFDKNQRQFRNKSPPSQQSDGRYGMNAHDRRRAGGGGGGGGGGDRRRMGGGGPGGDRSPRFGAGGDAGGGMRKPNRGNRSNSRSRSPSVERGGRSKASPPNVRSSGNRGNSPDRSDRHRHHHSSSSSMSQQQQQQQQQQAESGQQQQQQPGQPQPQDGEKRQRCRDFDEKGYCVRGETCPWDHGVNPVVFEGINNPALMNMSMREYNPDSPDLWARSANPSGIAGVPAPVPGPLAGPGGLASGAAGINPFSGSVRPAGLIGYPHLGDKVANGVAGNLAADYARSAATGVGFRGAAPMLPFPFNPTGVATPLQRELIPIPVVDAGGMGMGGDLNAQMQQGKRRGFDPEDSVAIADGPTKRKLPIGSRLGPRMPNMQNNCSLELRKVPRGLNTIAHLNNHFAKFGKIVNIQISYDGDPEAAIVTFSTHAEANVAYRSTEAVLNNRFIKVFWHSQDPNAVQPAGQDGGNVMPMTGGRKNSQYHLNNVPAMPTPSADSAKTTNASASVATSQAGGSAGAGSTTTTAADGSGATTTTTLAGGTVAATHVLPPSLRLKNNVAPRGGPSPANSMNLRKKQEEQAKAVVQLANGLRKRKQELLQSYVKQMKSTLELVERCEPNDPQRTKTLETIKILQETIDKLRKEIAAEQEQMQAQIQNQQPIPPAKKSKEQQKKELLDIELELFAQQQEGNDTTAIQKRLEELQRSLGIIPGAPGGPNAPLGGPAAKGHYQGARAAQRGRASYPEGPTRVDRRPKTIVVTGFTSEEADFVLGHFKHFGEITKHDVDKDIPQIILSYATRVNAEQAVIRGKLFKDKRLQIAWAPSVQPLTGPGSDSSNSKTLELKHDAKEALMATSELSEGDANVIGSDNMDTLPELRLEDEEEDEECEDRSWRR